MTYDEVMRRSAAPRRVAEEFDSLDDDDESDSGDEARPPPETFALPPRVSPPPSPKTYDEALRPPARARVVDDPEDTSDFEGSADGSSTTEEDPYDKRSPVARISALPENGVLAPNLLPSILVDDGVLPREPSLMPPAAPPAVDTRS